MNPLELEKERTITSIEKVIYTAKERRQNRF
jgi:hypothetical protein